MQKINIGRVVLGGLLAGLIINIWESVLNAPVLGSAWATYAKTLGGARLPSQGASIGLWVCWGFLLGLMSVWMYAAVRPRFGAGPKTAMIAGLAAFVLGGGLVSLAELNFGLPGSVILINFAVGLALTPPSTVAGAALYKEAAAPAAMSAGTGR